MFSAECTNMSSTFQSLEGDSSNKVRRWSPLSETNSNHQNLWSQKFFDPLIEQEEQI